MDPLSITGVIIAILQATASVKATVESLKDGPRKAADLLDEIESVTWLADQLLPVLQRRSFTNLKADDRLRYIHSKLQSVEANRSKLHKTATALAHGGASISARIKWPLSRRRIDNMMNDIVGLRRELSALMSVLQVSSGLRVSDDIGTLLGRTMSFSMIVRSKDLQSRNVASESDGTGVPLATTVDETRARHQATLGDPQLLSNSTVPSSTVTRNNSSPNTFVATDHMTAQEQCLPGISDKTDFNSFRSTDLCLFSEEPSLRRSVPCCFAFTESYVLNGALNNKVHVASVTQQYTAFTLQIFKIELLFATSPRSWKRVSVLATTTCSAEAADAAFGAPKLRTANSRRILPLKIQSNLENLLAQSSLHSFVTNVGFICFEQDGPRDLIFDPKYGTIAEDTENVDYGVYDRCLNDIYHMGIPHYTEANIAVIWRNCDDLVTVMAGARLCCMRIAPLPSVQAGMNGSPAANFLEDLYWMQRAGSCKGVSRLVGVVLDDTAKFVQGYLVQGMRRGSFITALTEVNERGEVIPWSRRLTWIRDLISIVVSLHKSSLVAGCIDVINTGFDEEGRVVLGRYTPACYRWKNDGGNLPPELRSAISTSSCIDHSLLTFASDIFQLGKLIWLIANHKASEWAMFTYMSHRDITPHKSDYDELNNPVTLSHCPDDTPQCVLDIINLSRAYHSSDRPSAAELLKLLPDPIGDAGTLESAPLDSTCNSWTSRVWCDECGSKATEDHYYCKVCNDGQFHLCPTCRINGVTCEDSRHVLMRRLEKTGGIVEEIASFSQL